MTKTSKKPLAWSKNVIKRALEDAGISLAQLSISNGYYHGFCSAAFATPNERAQELIVLALQEHCSAKVTAQEIWPERYDERGQFIVKKRGRRAGLGPIFPQVARSSNVDLSRAA